MKATVLNVKKDQKAVSKAGKLYYYTELHVRKDDGSEKTYKVVPQELRKTVDSLQENETVDLMFTTNEAGYMNLSWVGVIPCLNSDGSETNIPAWTVNKKLGSGTQYKSGKEYTQKDVEIEVMNALNVAATTCGAGTTLDTLIIQTKGILQQKMALVEYAKALRDGVKPDVSGDIYKGVE